MASIVWRPTPTLLVDGVLLLVPQTLADGTIISASFQALVINIKSIRVQVVWQYKQGIVTVQVPSWYAPTLAACAATSTG